MNDKITIEFDKRELRILSEVVMRAVPPSDAVDEMILYTLYARLMRKLEES